LRIVFTTVNLLAWMEYTHGPIYLTLLFKFDVFPPFSFNVKPTAKTLTIAPQPIWWVMQVRWIRLPTDLVSCHSSDTLHGIFTSLAN
jgi:hypothetical protein